MFGAQGESFGIVDERAQIIPAWLIESQIGSLLEKQIVSYHGAPWRGYIIDGVNKDGVWTSLTGFYVVESGGLAKADTINRGDVVLKINSRSVSSQDAAEQISSAQEEFKVVVWRKGKEVELVVKKVVVK